MYKKLQERIGYHFHDPSLLDQALTHSSYANEHAGSRLASNERLEFLGDAVLELSSSEFLFEKYPDHPEGELTKLRASIVCEPSLADVAEGIHLAGYLKLGKGEEATGGRKRPSIISDALEALIGAIYLDGGFADAKEFVRRFVMADIEKRKLFYDSKTILQEVVQQRNLSPLRYELAGEEGPEHDRMFTVRVWVGEQCFGSGTGHSKKAAEQRAAYKAILALQEGDPGCI